MNTIIEYKTDSGTSYFFSSLIRACKLYGLEYSQLKNAKLPVKTKYGTVYRHPINERKDIADAIAFFKKDHLKIHYTGDIWPDTEDDNVTTEVTVASGAATYFIEIETSLDISGDWKSSDPTEDNRSFSYSIEVTRLLDEEGAEISDIGELSSLIDKLLKKHGIEEHTN